MAQIIEAGQPQQTPLIDVVVGVKSEFGFNSQISTEYLHNLNEVELREVLKKLLTVGQVDPSPHCCEQVEAILREEILAKSLFNSQDFETRCQCGTTELSLWRGDITLIQVDAIVNAANSALLGCFSPNHPCIDNAIHCAAGPRLRMACRQLMTSSSSSSKNGEPTGRAQITPGFCLPSKHVLHTVGPIYDGKSPTDEGSFMSNQLASCYESCLDLASNYGIRSMAFCCISTGVFGFPNEPAAITAINTVKKWLSVEENQGKVDLVVFNVFTDTDEGIYNRLLQ